MKTMKTVTRGVAPMTTRPREDEYRWFRDKDGRLQDREKPEVAQGGRSEQVG
jgi:hypothetical protein